MPGWIWGLVGLAVAGIGVAYYHLRRSPVDPSAKREWKKRESTVSELESELQSIADRIQALQGESRCGSDGECRVVGIGTRVCGQFRNFVIYSTRDADEPALLKAIEDFNEAHKRLSNLSLKSESCGTPPLPIRCIRDHCQQTQAE